MTACALLARLPIPDRKPEKLRDETLRPEVGRRALAARGLRDRFARDRGPAAPSISDLLGRYDHRGNIAAEHVEIAAANGHRCRTSPLLVGQRAVEPSRSGPRCKTPHLPDAAEPAARPVRSGAAMRRG